MSAPSSLRRLREMTFAGIAVLGPLVPVWPRLLHPAPWIALAAALLGYLTQPSIPAMGKFVADPRDRRSALALLLSLNGTAIAAIVDYGYRAAWIPAPWSVWTLSGGLCIAAGLAMRVWSIRTLGRFFTVMVVVVENQRLIQEGPYRVLRHPSYTGGLLVAVGAAVLFESWIALAIALAGVLPSYMYRIVIEERVMADAMGAPYQAYKRNTWRLVPFLF